MNTQIYLLTDSKTAIQHTVKPKLVLNCQQSLEKLENRHRINLMWMPRHQSIAGNEDVDKLAKKCIVFNIAIARTYLKNWDDYNN